MPPHAVRWVRDQVCFLAVAAVMAAGFVYLLVGSGHWVRSTALMGASMVVAALLRAAVPSGHVGLLKVRGRWSDAAVYLAIGAVILTMDLRLHH